jgi:uncharacterized phage protein (TIGR01671 family)
MSNIPKFRAWHKHYKIMMRVSNIDYSYGQEIQSISLYDTTNESYDFLNEKELQEIELMQWTGLQVNGIDLYEGDIIFIERLDSFTSYNKCQVWFNNGAFNLVDIKQAPRSMGFDRVVVWENDKEYGIHDLMAWPITEIIGNIYSNPELLEVVA